MAIAVPLFIVVRAVYFAIKKKRPRVLHEVLLLLLLFMFTVGLLSQTVMPKIEFYGDSFGIVKSGAGGFNAIPLKVLADTFFEVTQNGNISYFIINFLGNIVMFMPFGFILPILYRQKGRIVILSGFLLSLFIEISQLFLMRGTDIDYLILNTLGVALGYLLYRLLCKNQSIFRFFEKFKP